MDVLQPDNAYRSAQGYSSLAPGQPCPHGCCGMDSQQRTVRTQNLNATYMPSSPEAYDHTDEVSHESLELEQLHINQENDILLQLEEQLNGRIDQVPVAVPMDWENVEKVLDQVMGTLSDVQDILAEVYPQSQDRARCLNNFLRGWQSRFAIRLQQSGLPEVDQQAFKDHLSMNLSVLLGSMNVRSVAHIPDEGFGDLPHLPSISPNATVSGSSPVAPFYMQPQEGAQCGRHAANMFFGYNLLGNGPGYENIRSDALFKRMKEADPCNGNRAPLVMLNASLFDYEVDYTSDTSDTSDTSGWSEKYVRKPVPESLDDLPGDFVLAAGRHYVCFRKDDDGQWYLLDSVANQPKAIKPSAYLQQVFKGLHAGNCSSPEGIAGKIVVICRDPGQQVEGFLQEPL